MKNFIQPGKVIEVAAPANVASGEAVLIGDILAVATNNYKSGEKGQFQIEGVFELPKKTSDNVTTAGKILFWDATDKELTLDDDGTNKPAAISVAPAGNTAGTVLAKLCPFYVTPAQQS